MCSYRASLYSEWEICTAWSVQICTGAGRLSPEQCGNGSHFVRYLTSSGEFGHAKPRNCRMPPIRGKRWTEFTETERKVSGQECGDTHFLFFNVPDTAAFLWALASAEVSSSKSMVVLESLVLDQSPRWLPISQMVQTAEAVLGVWKRTIARGVVAGELEALLILEDETQRLHPVRILFDSDLSTLLERLQSYLPHFKRFRLIVLVCSEPAMLLLPDVKNSTIDGDSTPRSMIDSLPPSETEKLSGASTRQPSAKRRKATTEG